MTRTLRKLSKEITVKLCGQLSLLLYAQNPSNLRINDGTLPGVRIYLLLKSLRKKEASICSKSLPPYINVMVTNILAGDLLTAACIFTGHQ